jgi:hypothetical protein
VNPLLVDKVFAPLKALWVCAQEFGVADITDRLRRGYIRSQHWPATDANLFNQTVADALETATVQRSARRSLDRKICNCVRSYEQLCARKLTGEPDPVPPGYRAGNPTEDMRDPCWPLANAIWEALDRKLAEKLTSRTWHAKGTSQFDEPLSVLEPIWFRSWRISYRHAQVREGLTVKFRNLAIVAMPPPLGVRPGPKGGEGPATRIAWEIAEQILQSAEGPPRGHGRLMALARMVKHEMDKKGKFRTVSSIVKYLRLSVREWEDHNPG